MASNRENETLEQTAKRVLLLQIGLTAALALLVFGYGLVSAGSIRGMGTQVASVVGLLFGSAIGMVSTMITKRSVSRASQAAIDAPEFGMAPIYIGLLNKLIVVGGGFALGLIALGLGPVYLVSGYIASHCALLLAARKAT